MFKAPGCELAYLNGTEQKVIDALILSAMAGRQKTDLRAYNSMINRHKPDLILLGCTELPLIFQSASSKHIDPLKIVINEYFAR
jgi:aspartate/glutamate racemase